MNAANAMLPRALRMSPLSRLSCVLAGVLLAHAAHAAPPRHVKLDYERNAGAERCPDSSELSDAVAADLGYDPFQTEAGETLRVRIARAAGELTATIELLDAEGAVTGRRELSSPGKDCRELAATLALAVSIAIDPVHSTKKPEPKPEPAPAPPPKPAPPPPAPAPIPKVEPAPEPASTPLHLRIAGGAHLAVGTAPAQALGFWAYAGARWPKLSLGLEGRADLAAEKSEPDGSVSASLLLGSLLPCVHLGVGFACAVGSLGVLQGSGEDVSQPAKATTLFGAAGARGGVDIPVSDAVGIVVQADVRANLARTTLRLNDREVWSSPPLSGDLGVGVRGEL